MKLIFIENRSNSKVFGIKILNSKWCINNFMQSYRVFGVFRKSLTASSLKIKKSISFIQFTTVICSYSTNNKKLVEKNLVFGNRNKFSGNRFKSFGNKNFVFGNSIKFSGNKKFVFGNFDAVTKNKVFVSRKFVFVTENNIFLN
jgi:hypothetical protein